MLVNNNEANSGSHKFARFAADSFGTISDRPKLVVHHSAVPEPTSFAYLATVGLVSLAIRRPRKRKHV